MSLAFKPRIPEFFKSSTTKKKNAEAIKPKPVAKAKAPQRRKKRMWTPEDLTLLIELRALALPHTRCGAILKRTANDTANAVNKHQLHRAIQARRKVLIEGVINER